MKRLVRIVALGLALLLVAVAAYSTLGRLVLAGLQYGEEAVAGMLTEQLGGEVTLASVHGDWRIWNPVVEVRELTFAPREAEPAIRVARLHIELDVVASLARLQLVPAELVVAGLVAEVEHRPDGRWRLQGASGADGVSPAELLSVVARSDYIEVAHARVRLHEPERAVRRLTLAGTARAMDQRHRGRLELDFCCAPDSDRRASGELWFDLVGHALEPQTLRGDVALSLEDVDAAAMPLPTAWRELGAGRLEKLTVRAELDQGTARRLHVNLSASALPVGRSAVAENVQLVANGWNVGRDAGRVSLSKMRAVIGGQRLALDDAKLGWTTADTRRWRLRLPKMKLADLRRAALALVPQSSRAARWMRGLAPRATLARIRAWMAEGHEQARPHFAVAAAVDDLELAPYRGAPAVAGADGQVVLYERGAWADIDSDDLRLHFPDVFASAWRFRSGQGHVQLRVKPNAVHVRSKRLRLRGRMGELTGRFALYLPAQKSERMLSLMMGIRDGETTRAAQFLPAGLPERLRRWVGNAVGPGRIERGVVAVSGLVERPPGTRRATEIYLEVADARLRYAPEWPVLSAAEGSVLMSAGAIRASLDSARLDGVDVLDADIRVPRARAEAGRTVQVEGRGRGRGEDLIALLQALPVSGTSAIADAGWAATGSAEVALDLELPVSGKPGAGTARRSVKVTTDAALSQLTLPYVGLALSDVQGELTYRHPDRLSADGISARLFGGRAEIDIDGRLGADQGLQVAFDGGASVDAVRTWLGLPRLSVLSGHYRYASTLDLPPDGPPRVHFESDLTGLESALPAPFDKSAEVPAPFAMDLIVPAGEPQRLVLSWAPGLSARVRVGEGRVQKAMVGINEAAPEQGKGPALQLSGYLEHLDAAAWKRTLEDVVDWSSLVARGGSGATRAGEVSDEAPRSDDSRSDDSQFRPFTASLRTASLSWGDMAFGAGTLDLGADGAAIEADVDVSGAVGRVRLLKGQAPLAVDFERLDLATGAAADAFAPDGGGASGVDLTAMMPASVSLDELRLDGEPYGSLAFEVRPLDQAIEVTEIEAALRGLYLGADDRGPAELHWHGGEQPRTHFRGRLYGHDIGEVLEAWGYTATVESDKFSHELSLDWPGAPTAFAAERLSGSIDFELERGRFTQGDAATGPLRMIGLFNLAALARRMRLDFTDLYKEGIAFEEVQGAVAIDDGLVSTVGPVRVVGPGSSFRISGDLGLADNRIAAELIATLPVSRALPWYAAWAALAANPLAGAGVFAAEWLLRDQIEKYSSAKYRIEGTLNDPELTFVSIFDNQLNGLGDLSAATRLSPRREGEQRRSDDAARAGTLQERKDAAPSARVGTRGEPVQSTGEPSAHGEPDAPARLKAAESDEHGAGPSAGTADAPVEATADIGSGQ